MAAVDEPRRRPVARPAPDLYNHYPEQDGDARTMKREQLTEKILDIKREKGWTWRYICDEIGGMADT